MAPVVSHPASVVLNCYGVNLLRDGDPEPVPLASKRCQNEPMSTIGERLREAREAAGIGVRELARLSGFESSHADVSKIEMGKQPRPSGPKLAAYAKVLGVSAEWLMTGEGPRARSRAEPNVDVDDAYPARASAIARMRGLVSDAAIATVRADQNLGGLSEAEWVEELLRADRLAKKGLDRTWDGQPHEGQGAVGRSTSKIVPRRR